MKGCRPLLDTEVTEILFALNHGPYTRRNQALFLLGLRSGFRIQELLSLRVKDVLQNQQVVTRVSVSRGAMKGKKASRSVPLHAEASKAIQLLLEETGTDPETFLFKSRQGGNKALNRRSAWAMLTKAYAKCGLTGKIGTHGMRKTYARRCHKADGGDLMKTQKALGHRQITSTMAYLSFTDEEIDDIILKS